MGLLPIPITLCDCIYEATRPQNSNFTVSVTSMLLEVARSTYRRYFCWTLPIQIIQSYLFVTPSNTEINITEEYIHNYTFYAKKINYYKLRVHKLNSYLLQVGG